MSGRLVAFCLRSLYREYGAAFLLQVGVAHPAATLRGIAQYARGETGEPGPWRGGPASLVGLGFCLKPLAPACPAGRPNHRCLWLESNGGLGMEMQPCRECLIRLAGQQALRGGSPVYIMTSARDMLNDVLRPALENRRFREAVMTMCRYSFEPMRLALAICGVNVRLVPFVHGDCRDYSTWRQADIGRKAEQTFLDAAAHRALVETLYEAAGSAPCPRSRRNGNLYEPV